MNLSIYTALHEEESSADAGFNLIINSRNLEKLKSVEKDLKSKHPIEIKIVDADVSETTGIGKIVKATQGLNVGLVITSAGYGTSGLFLDTSLHSEINMKIRIMQKVMIGFTQHQRH